MSKKSWVYDFETLSQNTFKGVVISLAALEFDEDRFLDEPYEFEELVENCHSIKFDVKEQVEKYDRIIEKRTIDWWSQQSKEAQRQLKPSKDDVSIDTLYDWLEKIGMNNYVKTVYTRGNTFDPVFLESIMKTFNKDTPYPWWAIRDFRSLFDGMTWGHNISNKFIPEGLEDKIVLHNPAHDISLDVMRFQYLVRLLND